MTSTTWKGPEPINGGLAANVAALSPGTLAQMCSGRIGIGSRSMLDLGRSRWNSTVVSSTATAFLMCVVLPVNAESSLSMM